MKQKRLLLLLLALLTLTACRNTDSGEQTTPINQPDAETAETVSPPIDLTPTTSPLPPTPPQSTDEQAIATLKLQITDGANVTTHDFNITEYTFFNGSLDDWLENAPSDAQPLVALGRVLAPPYRVSSPLFEPVWVAINPSNLSGTIISWEESANNEMVEFSSIYEARHFDESTGHTSLLQVRNEYYLPVAEGILWIEKLLLKTGEMYYFLPETETLAANLPYSLNCNDEFTLCSWFHRFKPETENSGEIPIVYDQHLLPTHYYHYPIMYITDDGEKFTFVCYFKEGVCEAPSIEVYESDIPEFSCEYNQLGEMLFCRQIHQDMLDNPRIFRAVAAEEVKWQIDESVGWIRDPIFHHSLLCNETRYECFSIANQDHAIECDTGLQSCALISVFDEPIKQFSLLTTKPEWVENYAVAQKYWSSDLQHEYLCHFSLQSCWEQLPEYRLLECTIKKGESAFCYFEKPVVDELLTVPVTFIAPVDFTPHYFEDGLLCDWALNICYDSITYDSLCSILTWECEISHRYLDESFTYAFTYDEINWTESGGMFSLPDSDLVCFSELGICAPEYAERGGGGALESKRCFRLRCPNGFWCSIARYNQYQCYLYNTPRPRP